jgi:hypothetical protein
VRARVRHTGRVDAPQEHDEDEGYEGVPYGGLDGSRFDWFWFGITWLTVPLFVAYVVYRVVT